MSKLMVNVIPFKPAQARRCTNCVKVLHFGECNPCDACLAEFYCDMEDFCTVLTENCTDH